MSQNFVYYLLEWDRYGWEFFYHHGYKGQVDQLYEKGKARSVLFPKFVEEVFHRLYASQPRKLPEIRKEALWAEILHERLSLEPKFELLRLTTAKNRLLAGEATLELCHRLFDLTYGSESLGDPQDLRDEYGQVQQQIDKLQDKLQKHRQSQGAGIPKEEQGDSQNSGSDSGSNSGSTAQQGEQQPDTGNPSAGGSGGGQSDPVQKNLEDRIQELLDKAKTIQQQGKKLVEKYENLARKIEQLSDRQIEQAVEKAQKYVNSLQQSLGGLSCGDEEGMPHHHGLKEKTELASHLRSNHRLKQIGRIAGNIKARAGGKQATMGDGKVERKGVTVGRDLPNVTSNELALLAVPAGRAVFASRHSSANLKQYRTQSRQAREQGYTWMLVDVSGSMKIMSGSYGTADIWASAVLCALVELNARKYKGFTVTKFAETPKQTWEFPKGRAPDPAMLIEAISFGCGGGTNFAKAIDLAIDGIAQKPNLQADIILISDGLSKISEPWLDEFFARKKQLKVTLYTILVGGNVDAAEKFSDRVVVLDLDNPTAAENLVLAV